MRYRLPQPTSGVGAERHRGANGSVFRHDARCLTPGLRDGLVADGPLQRGEILRLAATRKVSSIRVFGSVARGTPRRSVTLTCWWDSRCSARAGSLTRGHTAGLARLGPEWLERVGEGRPSARGVVVVSLWWSEATMVMRSRLAGSKGSPDEVVDAAGRGIAWSRLPEPSDACDDRCPAARPGRREPRSGFRQSVRGQRTYLSIPSPRSCPGARGRLPSVCGRSSASADDAHCARSPGIRMIPWPCRRSVRHRAIWSPPASSRGRTEGVDSASRLAARLRQADPVLRCRPLVLEGGMGACLALREQHLSRSNSGGRSVVSSLAKESWPSMRCSADGRRRCRIVWRRRPTGTTPSSGLRVWSALRASLKRSGGAVAVWRRAAATSIKPTCNSTSPPSERPPRCDGGQHDRQPGVGLAPGRS